MHIRKRKRRVRSSPFYTHAAATERAIILEALHDTAHEVWNVTKAAKQLGLPLSTMKFKIRRYKIERPA